MNKRKILSILASCLALILVIMTSVPIYSGGRRMQWVYLFRDFNKDGSPYVIFDIILMVAAFVLVALSFIIKKRAKLFITLSVVSTWVSGTAMAIQTLFHTKYGIIPLICYVVLCAPVLICNLVLKNEAAPQAETVSPGASSNASSQIARVNAGTVSSQTAVDSGAQKMQKNYMEDKPMTKKDAEAILAYIWVRQYNNLPFDEALDKIMAYLIENKYVLAPETGTEAGETEIGKSLPPASGDGATTVDYGKASKNMRLARQAREENNSEDAKLYYGKVREEDPESGEAKFYYAYYSLHEGKNIELQKRFGNLCTILPVSIKRIKESAMESAEQYKIIEDIVNSFAPEAWAEISYMRHMNIEEKVGDSYVTVFEENEIRMIYLLGSDALDALGEQIDALSVSDPEYKKIASVAWEEYLALQQNWYKYKKGSTDLKIIMTSFKELGDRLGDDPAYKKIALEAWSEFVTFAQKFYALVEKGEAEIYAEKIKKLDPSYIMPKKSGCISKA